MARISYAQATSFYNACGRWLDLQRWLEDPAFDDLLAHADLSHSHRIVEFGCGTGRLARRMLAGFLPPGAQYVGFDLSPRMLRISRSRLAPFGARAQVLPCAGPPRLALSAGCCDRFLATYVLDLLNPSDAAALLREAGRLLVPGGLLCVSVMAAHQGLPNRAFRSIWTALHRLSPMLVGGTQPSDACAILGSDWHVRRCQLICRFAVCSQVLIAERLSERTVLSSPPPAPGNPISAAPVTRSAAQS
jgi:SAM-dependent methyltransferase